MSSLEYVGRLPHPALRPYVGALHGWRYGTAVPELHRGLPGGFLTLIVTLDEPLGSAWPGGARETFDSLLGGLHSNAVHIGGTANRAGLQLAITPAGARALLGLPAGELAAQVLDLSAVLGPSAVRLTDRLRSGTSWRDRFDLIERSLLRRLDDRQVREPAAEIAWAWRRLRRSGGDLRVQDLASEVGWSRRHLSDRFAREYGLPPKVAARVLRFERAVAAIRRQPGVQLARLAADLGYADQAHLTREWTALAGCSPRQWLAEEFPFLQDLVAPDHPD